MGRNEDRFAAINARLAITNAVKVRARASCSLCPLWSETAKIANRMTRMPKPWSRLKGLQKVSEFLAVTRVYRGHVLAALTRPLACRLCRLQPPPPSPAPCRVYDGRARRSHRPALASRRYW